MFDVIQGLSEVADAISQTGFVFPIGEVVENVLQRSRKATIGFWLGMKSCNGGFVPLPIVTRNRHGGGLSIVMPSSLINVSWQTGYFDRSVG